MSTKPNKNEPLEWDQFLRMREQIVGKEMQFRKLNVEHRGIIEIFNLIEGYYFFEFSHLAARDHTSSWRLILQPRDHSILGHRDEKRLTLSAQGKISGIIIEDKDPSFGSLPTYIFLKGIRRLDYKNLQPL